MKNTARKTGRTEATRPQLREVLGEAARDQANVQLVLGLRHLVRENLREFVISAGTAALAAVLEEERTQVVGPKYAHLPDRHARRAGSAPRRRAPPTPCRGPSPPPSAGRGPRCAATTAA